MSVTDARARGALSSPSKIQIYIFCRKVDIFRKPFSWKKFQKKFYILRLIVKEIFHFEVLSVTDARVRGALSVPLRSKSSMYPRIVYRFRKHLLLSKKWRIERRIPFIISLSKNPMKKISYIILDFHFFLIFYNLAPNFNTMIDILIPFSLFESVWFLLYFHISYAPIDNYWDHKKIKWIKYFTFF